MTQQHSEPRLRRAAAGWSAVLALLTSAAAASAGPVGYTLSGPMLTRVDLATLELEPVGATGGLAARDLAFHPDGTLYGLSNVFSSEAGSSLQLASYDLATGAAQAIAEFEFGFPPILLGFAGDAQGGLWATILPNGTSTPMIVALDPVTGTVGELVEVVGPVGPSLAACGDLLVAPGGAGLVAIDPVSGATTLLLPDAPPANLDMAYGPDGAIWATNLVPITAPPTGVHRLDLSTGEITSSGSVFGVAGLAITPPAGGPCFGAPPAVPTLSPLALVALAGALGALGLSLARRRAGA